MGDRRASQVDESAGRVLRAIVVAGASLVLTSCAPQSAEQTTQAEIAGPAAVVNGETIEISGQRIHVFGYDAPHRDAYCGNTDVANQATLALSNFVASRTVSCALNSADNSDHLTATCDVGGADLGAHMVAAGWGRDQPRSKNFPYANEEQEARIAGRGVWALQCPANIWGD